ncbi:MAG: M28 family peptidase [Flavobacteriales bacterium]|nr:M28 family peptidase [Flavobacteriales bacterium]
MKLLHILSVIIVVAWVTSCSHSANDKSDHDKLYNSLSYLASDSLEGRGTGSNGERLAGDYIIAEFEKLGLEPKGDSGQWRQYFSYRPHGSITRHGEGDSAKLAMSTVKEIKSNNIVGYLDNHQSHTVVIGAHYDHLGWGDENSLFTDGTAIHNGADDNASGVSALLLLAEKLKGKYTNNNYLFIAFSGEEKGLWGSNYFCDNPTIDLDSVTYMLNMDMVGRLNSEHTLAVYGTGTSPYWNEILPTIDVDSIKITTTESGVGPSDHTSFYLEDIPVLHFFTGQHEDYHKPSDDVDKINFDGIESIIRYMEQVISLCDNQGMLEFTKTKEEDKDSTPAFKVTLGIMPDYLYSGEGMRIDGVTDGRTASKAGLLKGDIVLKMDTLVVEGMNSYMIGLGLFESGDTTQMVVRRNDEEIIIPVIWD